MLVDDFNRGDVEMWALQRKIIAGRINDDDDEPRLLIDDHHSKDDRQQSWLFAWDSKLGALRWIGGNIQVPAQLNQGDTFLSMAR